MVCTSVVCTQVVQWCWLSSYDYAEKPYWISQANYYNTTQSLLRVEFQKYNTDLEKTC